MLMNHPPLPTENGYWRSADERHGVVNALFDRSAHHYDRACAIMSFGTGQRYRREALQRAGLRPGMSVLDVGTGTGLLAREIVYVLGSPAGIVGIDPSRQMIANARQCVPIRLVRGVAERLPFPDAYFDFLTMGYALRHVPDLNQTFAEYRRVLKPNGRLLVLEISRPTSTLGLAIARTYFGTVVPLITRIGTGSASAAQMMRFYWDTIAECVPPDVILASMRQVELGAPVRTVIHGIFSEYTANRD